MHLLAFNYFNLDPAGNFASTTLGQGGNLFMDLQPIWGLVLTIGIAVTLVVILFRLLR